LFGEAIGVGRPENAPQGFRPTDADGFSEQALQDAINRAQRMQPGEMPGEAEGLANPTTDPFAKARATGDDQGSAQDPLVGDAGLVGPLDAATTRALIRDLDDRNVVRTIEAAETLVAAGAVEALPKLQTIDVRRDAYLAGPVLRGIGHLASVAEPKARDEAARHLGSVFRREAEEASRVSLGNALIAIDALADTRSQAAIAPLLAELERAQLPLSAQTLIVQSLSALDAKSATTAIAQFAERVKTLAPTEDSFEAGLRQEALAAVAEALTNLQHAK